MSTVAVVRPRSLRLLAVLGVVLAGAVAGAALLIGANAGGALIVAAPVGAVVLWWLARHPGVAAGLLFGLPLLLESDPQGFLPVARFYSRIAKLASPTDVLLVIAVIAAAVELSRRRQRLALPGPFTYPLLLLALSMVWGEVVGVANGASRVYALNDADALLYVVLAPVLVVNLVRRRQQVVQVMGGLAAMAVLKSLIGLGGWAAGKGRPLGGTHLTYYDPTPNLLLSAVVLTATAAVLAQVRLPRWVKVGMVLSLVTLLLSFRRSFWIGDGLAVAVIVLVASGQGRRWAVLGGVAAVGIAIAAALSFGGAGSAISTSSPLVQRVASISPTAVQQTAGDRYRIDEDRNVIAELIDHPVTGIGLGVPWTARYPMATASTGSSQYYNHVVILFLWLKLGLPGVIAYLWLWIVILATGWRLWRSSAPAVVRVGALGLAGTLMALAVVELTASFTGADPRASMVIGGAIGLLAAARTLWPDGAAGEVGGQGEDRRSEPGFAESLG
ncbi:MAG TPA: O-antigen ligase family protein [Acidimicrobiales bacterium]|nr:O-antigen ligase family protein [Acidimicrobiales bacterium]